ncbi:TonB-dependent hemoglobin/transferrin/lactoferrin family receptor, partial [Ramlibacter sp.]|uniref:TonB-dependent hemoglobin/transferrin/lactoferrin family receptor n=1 Tax=Ramlibacter sp. TaxID=1917967 RepID=UPI003D104F6C
MALAAAFACLPVAAQTQEPVTGGRLKEVVISGSRSEQEADDLPASNDVIGRRRLEERQVRNIRDLAREVPNMTVQRSPARFTLAGQPAFGRDRNAGFNLRGLDGNRVLILSDGIRQPRSYIFSANAFGRDYLDVGLIQRVEVVRGAASALYGSDGLGGLVNFITTQPGDLLQRGRDFGGTASVGYDGDDGGWRTGATLAGRFSDSAQWLVGATVGRASALDNQGTNDAANVDRTTPNPENARNHSLLGKILLTPGGGQRHTFTLEHVDKHADYNLLSNIAKPPLAATSTVAANAFTDQRRTRGTWDGRWKPAHALADDLQAVLSWQDADAREYSFEDRNTSPDRIRDTTYRERTAQANLQASKTWNMSGGWLQKLTYGIDLARTDVRNLQTGLTPAAGETFPLKRFPDTRESSTAVYVQDEIMSDHWVITPGVRIDRFSLDASQDGFSPPATTPAASLSGSATSPKLGVLYRVTPMWSVFGNYAHGFKAPNAGQVNAFFENPTFFYKAIPNPKLKPEKSRTFELGLRGRLASFDLDVAAFAGRYRDFIEEQQQVSGAGVAGNPTIFQTVNIGNVRIAGFEVKGDARWGTFAGGKLSTPFAYGRASGKDTNTGRPVNSVNPSRLNAGLKFDAEVWAVRLDATHWAAKKASDIHSAGLVT